MKILLSFISLWFIGICSLMIPALNETAFMTWVIGNFIAAAILGIVTFVVSFPFLWAMGIIGD